METNDQQEPSKEVVEQPQKNSESDEGKKFVPAQAYKEVSSDMHKYKSRSRELEAELNKLREEAKLREENELKEKQEYQTLYEREKAAREQAEINSKKQNELFVRARKLSALKGELGGKVKDEYLSFANLDKIEVKEDGSLSSESVQAVANSFRQDHPGLIESDSGVNITGPAARGIETEQPAKTLKDLTTEQKVALLEQIKANKHNRS